ncbi:CDP-glycerol glycerophosphotransferase family protein [Dactylosporangium sp. NPDC051541]|uniref:CDP-glycerol glycerophosphotransferase family protein n=1 Tax=Dactylosporangium sp. NPDC051541 TaxID=3363977 RepID=UPI003794F6BB
MTKESGTIAEARPVVPAPSRRWPRIPHRDVVLSSGALFGSTAVTSVLGFAYWSLLARAAPPEAVGVASALVSALTLLGTIGMFGFGTMLIGELAAEPRRAADLIPASLLVSSALSCLLALVFVGGSRLVSPELGGALGSWLTVTLFTAGVVLSAIGFVFDQASVGLGIAQVQLWRNTWFSLAKILFIPLVAVVGGFDWVIVATWVAGMAVSMVLIAPGLHRRGLLAMRRPRRSALSGLGWVTVHHNTLNLSLSIPRMAVPVVVGGFLPSAVTAAFYAAWMIASFLYAIPTHLATTLFAVAAGDRASLARKARLTLGASAAIGVVVVAPVVVFGHQLMRLFGAHYAVAGTGCLVVLALAYPTQVVKQHYAAVLRVEGRVSRAGLVCSVAAVAELVAVTAGAVVGGPTQIALLQGAVLLVEAVVMTPVLVRAVRRGGGARAALLDRLTTSLLPRLGRLHRVRTAVRLAQLPARVAVGLLARHWPRDPRTIVFGAPLGRFGDNPAYLFLAAQEHFAGHRTVWITPSRAVRDRLREAGYRAELRWSRRGIAMCLRAGAYVYSSYPNDINRWLYDGALTFNLWHGIPFKRIERDITSVATRRRGVAARLEHYAYADEHHVPDLLLSTSATVSERCFTSAFAIPRDRCVAAGYPRTDHFRAPPDPGGMLPLLSDRALWRRLSGAPLVVGYFPTWRDNHGDFLREGTGLSLRRLAEVVAGRGGTLLFKPHGNTLNAPAAAELHTAGIATLEPADDINAFLPLCHVLITDYSSVAFDFMLLERPIVYYVPDLDEYLASRGSYFSPAEAMPGRLVNEPADLYRAIAEIDLDAPPDRRMPQVRSMLWADNVSGASARIAEHLKAALAGRHRP